MSQFHTSGDIQVHRFDNGLCLVYQPSPTPIPLTSLQVFCNVGSAFETDGHRGMAHMVEHMVFKGTQKRMPKEIFELFDKFGADFNAYTTKRLTCYTFKCDSLYVPKCIPVMADMLFRSTFPKAEYDKEKQVVEEENIRDKNDEARINYELFCRIAYAGNSFMYPVDTLEYHTKKNDWTLKQVREWYRHYYQPQHMVFSVVSSLPFRQILSLVEKTEFAKKSIAGLQPETELGLRFPKRFSHSSASSSASSSSRILPNRMVCEKKKGMTNTHIMLGYPSYDQYDPRRFCMRLVSQLLNGMSGRLFMQLREKTPLTYRSFSEIEYEEFGGHFVFVVECSNANVFRYQKSKPGVIPVLIDIVESLCKKGITQKELDFAKSQMRNANLMRFEDIDSFCDHNGRFHLVYDSDATFVTFDQFYEKVYKPITLREVNACIRDVFAMDKCIVTMVSNDPPSVKTIEKEVKKCLG
jgi:predicted Zn-dependent peptidase